MRQKVNGLLDLLRARTKKGMSIEDRRPTILFQLMAAIDAHFEATGNTDGKYHDLAKLLLSPVNEQDNYLTLYEIRRGADAEYTSEEVAESVSYAKQGNDKNFISAIIHCIWDNQSQFPFLNGKLTDPTEFDDGDGATVWAALAYADLYNIFVGGNDAPGAVPQTGRADGLTRIQDDYQIAQQRIAYSLDTGSPHVSFADLRIEFLPDELNQVHFMDSLDLRNTNIKSLPNLSKFKKLKTLNCSYMPITDVKFVNGCENLDTFFVGVSDVSTLDGIGGAPNLKRFYCGSTYVTDLSPLANCCSLEHVSCENLYINSLGGLENSPNLHTVDCGTTQVTSLKPLEGADKLRRLVLSGCDIDDDSTSIWTKRSLKEVTFFKGRLAPYRQRY